MLIKIQKITVSKDEYSTVNGGLIWQLWDADTDEDTSAEILFFDAPDEETAEKLLQGFTERVAEADTKISFFELQELDDMRKIFLEEAGFAIEERKSKSILVTVREAFESKLAVSLKYPEKIVPLADVENILFRQGITNCLFSGMSGLYDDLAILPKDWYEQYISCCAILDKFSRSRALRKKLCSHEKTMAGRKIGTDTKTFHDLSVFLTGNSKTDKRFLDNYLGTEMNPETEEIKGRDKNAAMDFMAEKLLSISLAGIDFTTDNKMVKSAKKLEEIFNCTASFNRFLENDPEYLESLDDQKREALNEKLCIWWRPSTVCFCITSIGNSRFF